MHDFCYILLHFKFEARLKGRFVMVLSRQEFVAEKFISARWTSTSYHLTTPGTSH